MAGNQRRSHPARELFEETIADIYGPNQLFEKGILPAGLIAASPEYLRPMVGIRPAAGHFLHFCAFELGGGRTGSGGYSATAPSAVGRRLCPGEPRRHDAGAFGYLWRDACAPPGRLLPPLSRRADRHGQGGRRPRRHLTPGRSTKLTTNTPISHAIWASCCWRERILRFRWQADGTHGFRLDADQRAVAAARRRVRRSARTASGFADRHARAVEAIRHGAVSTVNSLGSGLMETRALLAFLPKISRALRGEELLLPSVRDLVVRAGDGARACAGQYRAHGDRAGAVDAPGFEDDEQTKLGSALTDGERAELVARIERDGGDFVGQEAVTLSTTPVYVDGWLEPRPASLRVYLARTPEGWTVMPGGFARVGLSLDPNGDRHAARRPGGRCLGGQRQTGRARDAAAAGKRQLHPHKARQPAQSRGGEPDLARPLHRTFGRYGAHPARYHVRLAETSDPDMPLLADVRDYLDPFGIDVEAAIRPA